MENQDKIYLQFKNAAEKSEAKDFPNRDKVWNRVEEKLDQKVLKKESKLWKKIAVAASVLLVVSVLYQFLKSDDKNVIPENVIVETDTVSANKKIITTTEKAIASEEFDTSIILKKEAVKILEKQIAKQADVVSTYSPSNAMASPAKAEVNYDSKVSEDAVSEFSEIKNRKFDAIGVIHQKQKEATSKEESEKKTIQISTKTDPLLVINNNAVTSKEGANYSTISKKELAKIKDEDLETVVYLKEPLYIIDGKQYSEEELFGKNPTSPYAPLNEQEIKTTKVLQGEEAIAAYGEKGTKGVLIITTKNGKPAKKVTTKP